MNSVVSICWSVSVDSKRTTLTTPPPIVSTVRLSVSTNPTLLESPGMAADFRSDPLSEVSPVCGMESGKPVPSSNPGPFAGIESKPFQSAESATVFAVFLPKSFSPLG
jgi:hypothetical protein